MQLNLSNEITITIRSLIWLIKGMNISIWSYDPLIKAYKLIKLNKDHEKKKKADPLSVQFKVAIWWYNPSSKATKIIK